MVETPAPTSMPQRTPAEWAAMMQAGYERVASGQQQIAGLSQQEAQTELNRRQEAARIAAQPMAAQIIPSQPTPPVASPAAIEAMAATGANVRGVQLAGVLTGEETAPSRPVANAEGYSRAQYVENLKKRQAAIEGARTDVQAQVTKRFQAEEKYVPEALLVNPQPSTNQVEETNIKNLAKLQRNVQEVFGQGRPPEELREGYAKAGIPYVFGEAPARVSASSADYGMAGKPSSGLWLGATADKEWIYEGKAVQATQTEQWGAGYSGSPEDIARLENVMKNEGDVKAFLTKPENPYGAFHAGGGIGGYKKDVTTPTREQIEIGLGIETREKTIKRLEKNKYDLENPFWALGGGGYKSASEQFLFPAIGMIREGTNIYDKETGKVRQATLTDLQTMKTEMEQYKEQQSLIGATRKNEIFAQIPIAGKVYGEITYVLGSAIVAGKNVAQATYEGQRELQRGGLLTGMAVGQSLVGDKETQAKFEREAAPALIKGGTEYGTGAIVLGVSAISGGVGKAAGEMVAPIVGKAIAFAPTAVIGTVGFLQAGQVKDIEGNVVGFDIPKGLGETAGALYTYQLGTKATMKAITGAPIPISPISAEITSPAKGKFSISLNVPEPIGGTRQGTLGSVEVNLGGVKGMRETGANVKGWRYDSENIGMMLPPQKASVKVNVGEGTSYKNIELSKDFIAAQPAKYSSGAYRASVQEAGGVEGAKRQFDIGATALRTVGYKTQVAPKSTVPAALEKSGLNKEYVAALMDYSRGYPHTVEYRGSLITKGVSGALPKGRSVVGSDVDVMVSEGVSNVLTRRSAVPEFAAGAAKRLNAIGKSNGDVFEVQGTQVVQTMAGGKRVTIKRMDIHSDLLEHLTDKTVGNIPYYNMPEKMQRVGSDVAQRFGSAMVDKTGSLTGHPSELEAKHYKDAAYLWKFAAENPAVRKEAGVMDLLTVKTKKLLQGKELSPAELNRAEYMKVETYELAKKRLTPKEFVEFQKIYEGKVKVESFGGGKGGAKISGIPSISPSLGGSRISASSSKALSSMPPSSKPSSSSSIISSIISSSPPPSSPPPSQIPSPSPPSPSPPPPSSMFSKSSSTSSSSAYSYSYSSSSSYSSPSSPSRLGGGFGGGGSLGGGGRGAKIKAQKGRLKDVLGFALKRKRR